MDPTADGSGWKDLSDEDRDFYLECVAEMLRHRELLMRLLGREVTGGNEIGRHIKT